MDGDTPTISVIMPVYNAEAYVKSALLSVLQQTYENFELLVINDGSTDLTLDIIKQFADRRIRLINLNDNAGIVNALNIGIELARGKYIARMDADDVAFPTRFEEQLGLMQKRPEIGVIGTRCMRIDANGKKYEKMISVINAMDVNRYLSSGMNPIIHGSTLIRSSLLRELHGYRNSFLYAEDYDLWLRIIERSEIQNLKKCLIYYRTTPGGIRLNKIIESVKSYNYAYDCYKRRVGNIPELTREEYLKTVDLTTSEINFLWSISLELLLVGELERSRQLLSEIQKRNSKILQVNQLINMIDAGIGKPISVLYSVYRRFLGFIVVSPFSRILSDIKHWRRLR